MSGQRDENDQVPEQNRQPRESTQAQGQPQPQPTESIGDLATAPDTKSYVKFLTAVFALVGAAAGLSVVFVKFVGGAPLSPEILVNPSTFVKNFDSMMGQLYANRLAFQTMNAAPAAAGVLGVAGGLYIASDLDGSDRHSYVAAGLAGGVGALVLVLIVGVVSSFAVSPVPMPKPTQTTSGLSGTTMELQRLQQASGAISAIYIGGTKLAFQKLALNALAIGVGVGVVSAGSAYVQREFNPNN